MRDEKQLPGLSHASSFRNVSSVCPGPGSSRRWLLPLPSCGRSSGRTVPASAAAAAALSLADPCLCPGPCRAALRGSHGLFLWAPLLPALHLSRLLPRLLLSGRTRLGLGAPSAGLVADGDCLRVLSGPRLPAARDLSAVNVPLPPEASVTAAASHPERPPLLLVARLLSHLPALEGLSPGPPAAWGFGPGLGLCLFLLPRGLGSSSAAASSYGPAEPPASDPEGTMKMGEGDLLGRPRRGCLSCLDRDGGVAHLPTGDEEARLVLQLAVPRCWSRLWPLPRRAPAGWRCPSGRRESTARWP